MTNKTINLAYGEGNTLVRAAELIASELGVEPNDHDGALARRRGDPLRRRRDEGARAARLGAGDAARRRHPADRSRGSASGARRIRRRTARSSGSARTRRSTMASSSRPAPAPSGPRALRADRVGQDSRRRPARASGSAPRSSRPTRRPCTQGLPVLTAAPPYPARLVGIVPLAEEVSVGEYQRRAHAAIDEIAAAGRLPLVVGGTGLYLRAALGELELPPPRDGRAARALGGRVRPARPGGCARAARRARPRRRGAGPRERPEARRPGARAGRGRRVARAERGPRSGPTARAFRPRRRARPAARRARRRIEARTRAMVAGAWSPRRAPRGRGRSRAPRARCSGSRSSRPFRSDEAVERVVQATRRLARYQRKWLRRLPAAVTLDGDPPRRGDRR